MRSGAWHHRISPYFLKSPVSKWRIVRVKNPTKAFFFEEITCLKVVSKGCSISAMPFEAKLKEPTLSECKQLFDEQVARTKDDYNFSTAKEPLFNSTRICKVENHYRQEQRCDCVRTDRNLSMPDQNLKGQYRRAYPDYLCRGKE